MIRTEWTNKSEGKGKVVLYSHDGSKKLGEWGFTTEKGQDRAKDKAKDRERQIKYFESENS